MIQEKMAHTETHMHTRQAKMTQCMWNGNLEDENPNSAQNKY